VRTVDCGTLLFESRQLRFDLWIGARVVEVGSLKFAPRIDLRLGLVDALGQGFEAAERLEIRVEISERVHELPSRFGRALPRHERRQVPLRVGKSPAKDVELPP
jgi:hypothetical protein